MFPFNLNQASDTVNYMTEFRDEGHDLHPPPLALAAGHPTPFSGPSFFSILHDQGDGGDRGRNQHEESFNVSATSMMSQLVSRLPDDDADSGSHVKLSLCDHYIKEEEDDDDVDVRSKAKWMPSKIRFVRKTMNMDRAAGSRTRRHAREAQDRSSRVSNYYGMGNINMSPSGDDVVRVCSDCHTTKTPLWRSGPCGPKSLCNACGIRQRKARRAMAASAAATANSSRLVPSPPVPTKAAKEKKLHVDDRTVPFKKRCKFAGAETTGQPQLCFEDDVTLSLGTRATMATSTHRPFPQDEREAAILLMALSYGLVRS